MNIRRRLLNLEKQEAPKAAGSPEFQKTRQMVEQSRQRWRDDPEGMEKKRQESLRQLGFPEGSTPSWKEHLQRWLEQRDEHPPQVAQSPMPIVPTTH